MSANLRAFFTLTIFFGIIALISAGIYFLYRSSDPKKEDNDMLEKIQEYQSRITTPSTKCSGLYGNEMSKDRFPSEMAVYVAKSGKVFVSYKSKGKIESGYISNVDYADKENAIEGWDRSPELGGVSFDVSFSDGVKFNFSCGAHGRDLSYENSSNGWGKLDKISD